MSNVAGTPGTFSEVHVVSDLHLGGRPDFQIFNQTSQLAGLIEHLITRDVASLVLVLNGDIVDFLAEEPAAYLDPAGAVGKLERIVLSQQFSEVWNALRRLVKQPGRYLALVLGNHDVELALPHVRAWLTEWLSPGDDAARGRILWAVDGAGFSCNVGGRRVLCLHGNEVDEWNVVDHRALLQVARDLNRQKVTGSWVPNAGTRLVLDVMNEIKRDFPMVDLLKPETNAAIPMLLAMKPSLARAAARAVRAASRKVWDGLRMTAGFLGEEPIEDAERPSEVEALFRAVPGLRPSAAPASSVEKLAIAAQQRIDRGVASPTATPNDDEFLGVTDWFSETRRPEALRNALASWLEGDRTWELGEKDATFRKLDEAVGTGIHYLIAGHTHLRRAIKRNVDGCYYYNTGTWIRLIRLDKVVVSDPKAFEDVFKALKSPTMTDLDQARYPTPNGSKPLVMNETTVASIYRDGEATYGVLQNFNGETGSLDELPGTRFPEKVIRG
jgi:UDP-2,3-diacylglucosamine pyrophosphatase LpxH